MLPEKSSQFHEANEREKKRRLQEVIFLPAIFFASFLIYSSQIDKTTDDKEINKKRN